VKVHPLAVVHANAKLGSNVEIGPFSVVEAGVEIGDDCVFESRVTVKTGTRMGCKNHVCEGAILGGLPQHVRVPDHLGDLVLGSGNTIRENVTIHRALHVEQSTVLGDNNLVMVNVHIAHDCVIGNNTIMANNAMLAGHITVADKAYISGAVGIHQFCRVGRLAMVGGQAHVVKDVPPFVTVDGATTFVVGLNLVGLRRSGFTAEEVAQLKAAYRVIYRSGMPWAEIVARLRDEFPTGPAAEFHEFFSGGKRGFTPERRMPPTPTLRLRAAEEESESELRRKAG